MAPINIDLHVIEEFAQGHLSMVATKARTADSDAQVLEVYVSALLAESWSMRLAGPCALKIYDKTAAAIVALLDTMQDRSRAPQIAAQIERDLQYLDGYLCTLDLAGPFFTDAEAHVIICGLINLRACQIRLASMHRVR